MTICRSCTQRLNLHAVLGGQRADVGSIRAIWSIQDRIALDDAEEKCVELKREMVAGQERAVWNPTLSIPAKEFKFTDLETRAHQSVDGLERERWVSWDKWRATAPIERDEQVARGNHADLLHRRGSMHVALAAVRALVHDPVVVDQPRHGRFP